MQSRSQRPILALALTGLCTLLATPSPASAGDRCEGTLCDLYYEHMASPPPPARPAPAQTTPAQKATTQTATTRAAPTQSSSATQRKLVAVQGGGLIGMMNGTAPKRCTGTLCDLFYGGPPPEEPAVTPTEAAVAPESAPDEAVPASPVSRIEAPTEEDTRPSCVADAHDPWRCYRR